jgi:hypothetical protein
MYMKWLVNIACVILEQAKDCYDSLKAQELGELIECSRICHRFEAQMASIKLEYLPEFAIVRTCILDVSDILRRSLEQWTAFYKYQAEHKPLGSIEHLRNKALRLMALMRARAQDVFNNELASLYDRVCLKK